MFHLLAEQQLVALDSVIRQLRHLFCSFDILHHCPIFMYLAESTWLFILGMFLLKSSDAQLCGSCSDVLKILLKFLVLTCVYFTVFWCFRLLLILIINLVSGCFNLKTEHFVQINKVRGCHDWLIDSFTDEGN